MGVAMTGVAWTKKKVVERERHSDKIKIILFKWSCKKNRMFDVWWIVKWYVKIDKVGFWSGKC